MRGMSQPILAGVVLAVVGFASSFAVVVAGLRAVGASGDQAASGLLVLCLAMGLAGIFLGLRYRMPLSVAWSTPGAALLVAVGGSHVRYREALGAFLITGFLFVLVGLSRRLARLLAAIPAPLASAMLAGVLLPLCIAPVQAVARYPGPALPIVLVWAVLFRWARRWAVPGALVVAIAAILITQPWDLGGSRAVPKLTAAMPAFSVGALVGIAVPLFIVTMASQNLAGMSMLATFDYHPPLRPILLTTGTASMAAAPFGGHAVNLAAITAALAAGPDAHPSPERRWIASVTAGFGYLLLGLSAGVSVALIASAPPLLIESVAGLALLGTLGSAIQTALSDPDGRDAAVITFVVTASGIAPFGIGGAFWGLLAGLAFRAFLSPPEFVRRSGLSRVGSSASPGRTRSRRSPTADSPAPQPQPRA